MVLSRREMLSRLGGGIATAGLGVMAGCSSSCPDTGRPTAEETISFDETPTGPLSDRPAGQWPAETADSGNTGYTSVELPERPITVRWATQLDIPTEDGVGVVASAPVVGTERVFVADPNGVHALELKTGTLDWHNDSLAVTATERYGTYRPETVAPRVGPEGRVFVGLESGIVAVDPADGSVLWRDENASSVAPPTIAGGVVVAQGSNSVRGYDPDGTVRWNGSVNRGRMRRQPAGDENTVVISTETGLRAFDPKTGDVRWNSTLQTESIPVLADGRCFVGTDDGLVGIDGTSGTELFTYTRGDYMAFQSLVVSPDTVYVVEQPPEAGAATFGLARTSDGVEPRWCSYVGDGVVSAATDTQALTLLSLGTGPGSERSLAAFSAGRGEVSWAITGGSRSDVWLNPPALLDGVVFLTTRGGRTVAITEAE